MRRPKFKPVEEKPEKIVLARDLWHERSEIVLELPSARLQITDEYLEQKLAGGEITGRQLKQIKGLVLPHEKRVELFIAMSAKELYDHIEESSYYPPTISRIVREVVEQWNAEATHKPAKRSEFEHGYSPTSRKIMSIFHSQGGHSVDTQSRTIRELMRIAKGYGAKFPESLGVAEYQIQRTIGKPLLRP